MIKTETSFTQLQASVEATTARARELRAASFAIQQRLSVTCREIEQVFNHTQATLRAVHQHLASLRTGSAEQNGSEGEPVDALLKALDVLGRCESDLEESIDDLITAFKTASALGDEDKRTLFANALMMIGRHLATQVGPKAAGVIMN